MCEWLSDKLERTPGWINQIWFSGEAHFHLNGGINNHNKIFWDSEIPEVTETQLKSSKATEFIAHNVRHGILGSYWFEKGSRIITTNVAQYREIITVFHVHLNATLFARQLRMVWFMQDGAPPYTTHDTIAYLHHLFNNCLIAHDTTHDRPTTLT